VRDGLLVQAIAVCKLILQLDPTHATTAARLAELAAPSAAEARTLARMPRAPSPVGGPVMTSPATEKTRPPSGAAPSPAELAARAAKQPQRPVALPPGGALDAIPLALVMPDSQRVVRPDGTDAGMAVLRVEIPLEEIQDQDSGAVEIEIVDPARVALLRTPVFSQLPPDALERLIGKLALRELASREQVFAEGEPGATMFVVSEGEVAVESGGRELAKLGPGAFFGEIALVTDLPRSATVRALGRVELLAIDRDVVREAAAERPEIVSALLGFVRDRLVDRVTRTSALFQQFDGDERERLAGKFDLVEVDPGTQLITQGARADGLYIVLAGRVEVARDGEAAPIAKLGSGDVFGEMSLMSTKGSVANVRATSRVLALRLPAFEFQEMIVTYPQVLAYLSELADSRSRLKHAEDILDLHIDLL
jgi:CRP-like cAMP-binding protein